jgi:DNA-binding LacI/PurR family transcriptional regulator
MPTLTETRGESEAKYAQLEARLREQIARGALKPGDRLPSLAEMRDEYDLSRTTVERVHVRLEQEGLIRREQGRGTFVSAPPPRAPTGLIGFCASGLHTQPRTHYWTHLLEGVQEVAEREQKNIVLLHREKDQGWDKVDAALIADTYEETWRARVPARMPHVSLLYPARSTACVLADDYQGGEIATEYLLRLGHRRIACLEFLHNPLSKRRLAGYRDALQTAGIEPQAEWVRPLTMQDDDVFEVRGEEAMHEWLQCNWGETSCTAMLVQNDHFAQGAMRALQKAGLRVPEDVSVIGFDGTETGERMTPRLTSVAVPLREIGATGMELLLRQIATGQKTKSTTLLPAHLQIRDSTAPKK